MAVITKQNIDNYIYLPEITDNSSVIKEVKLHWLVKDDVHVNQGDKLMEVSTDTGAKYTIGNQEGRFW